MMADTAVHADVLGLHEGILHALRSEMPVLGTFSSYMYMYMNI